MSVCYGMMGNQDQGLAAIFHNDKIYPEQALVGIEWSIDQPEIMS